MNNCEDEDQELVIKMNWDIPYYVRSNNGWEPVTCRGSPLEGKDREALDIIAAGDRSHPDLLEVFDGGGPYGVVMGYHSGESIRDATRSELIMSILAAEGDGGPGVIDLGNLGKVYVRD